MAYENNFLNNPLFQLGAGILGANHSGASFGQALGGGMQHVNQWQQQQLMAKYRQAMIDQMTTKSDLTREKFDYQKKTDKENKDLLAKGWVEKKTATGQAYFEHPVHGIKMGTRPKSGGLLGGIDINDPATRARLLGQQQDAPAPEKEEGGFWSTGFGGSMIDSAKDWMTNPGGQVRKAGEVLGMSAPTGRSIAPNNVLAPSTPPSAHPSVLAPKEGQGYLGKVAADWKKDWGLRNIPGQLGDLANRMTSGSTPVTTGTGKEYSVTIPHSPTMGNVTREEAQVATQKYIRLTKNITKTDVSTLKSFVEKNYEALTKAQIRVIKEQIKRRTGSNPNWKYMGMN